MVQQNLVKNVRDYAEPMLTAQDASMGHLTIYIPSQMQAHASQGYFLNLRNLEYIDLEHTSWTQRTTEQLTFGNKLFYNTSDFLLQDKSRTYFLIYNREMARAKNYGYFEDKVADNTWTIDFLATLMKEFTYELDGDDKMTTADMWALVAESTYSFSAFCFGAGLSLSSLDSDGYPVLTGATEHMVDIVDTLAGIVMGTDTKNWFYDNHPKVPSTDTYYSASTTQLGGHALLHCVFPSVFDTAYSVGVPFEYGFLPFPKFDSNQKYYNSTPNYPNGSLFSIPYVVEDEGFAAFALQAITEEATDTSYYAFIEQKCKLDESFDQRCADMLDLVFQNVNYDIVAMGDYGGLNKLICTLIPTLPTMSFATLYPTYAGLAKTKIEEIKTAYENLD